MRERDALELRAVAPLVVTGTEALVGPALLVTAGARTVVLTSVDVLRAYPGRQLAIASRLDGSALVEVASWGLGRYAGIGVIELASPVPEEADVVPLSLGSICATVDTRGAPSALVTICDTAPPFVRAVIPVHVGRGESGGICDAPIAWLATTVDPAHASVPIDGAALFSWFPADPVLGRDREVLAVAVAEPCAAIASRRRAGRGAPIAELLGLGEIGRALMGNQPEPQRTDLHEVAGEIDSLDEPTRARLG